MKRGIITVLLVAAATIVQAKPYRINTTVTDSDGCVWKIEGTIDISTQFGWPPVKVNGYNLTMSGPCGSHSFSGLVGGESPDGGRLLYNFKVYSLEQRESDLNDVPAVMDVINQLEKQFTEGEVKEEPTNKD